MLFAGLVVEERAILREVGDDRGRDPCQIRFAGVCPRRIAAGGGHIEQVQRDSRVAVGILRNRCERVVVDREPLRAESAFRIVEARAHDPARWPRRTAA